jgi:hypothetical protein
MIAQGPSGDGSGNFKPFTEHVEKKPLLEQVGRPS